VVLFVVHRRGRQSVYDKKPQRYAKTTEKHLLVHWINLKPKQVIVKDCGRGTVLLKLTNDRHEASRGLSETAQLLVVSHSGSAWADHTIFRKTVQN